MVPDDPLRAFPIYARGLAAELYRVTAIRLSDGAKQAFVVGPKGGFKAVELPRRMAELARLSRRGENIYFTPISVNIHHLLVDDLNEANFKRLIDDGFRPAVVLESSPGNFQAILNVLKIGSAHDRAVGNSLVRALNKKYGDPNLSGAVHPHRAPGFSNQKPKHRLQDGSFPIVKLIHSESNFCEKSFDLSKSVDAEYEGAVGRQNDVIGTNGVPRVAAYSAVGAPAFRIHRRDAIFRMGLKSHSLDFSRLDAMVAIRMRVVGHSRETIFSAILHCAPDFRPSEAARSRNWIDYAIRTTNYVFGPAGDEQFARLSKYKTQWKLLELRQKL